MCNHLFEGECWECPAGTTCPSMGMNETLPCPAGFYCTNGTYNDGTPCPVGKYSQLSQMSITNCGMLFVTSEAQERGQVIFIPFVTSCLGLTNQNPKHMTRQKVYLRFYSVLLHPKYCNLSNLKSEVNFLLWEITFVYKITPNVRMFPPEKCVCLQWC